MGFEPTISAGERPKTYALDRAATGTGTKHSYYTELYEITLLSVWGWLSLDSKARLTATDFILTLPNCSPDVNMYPQVPATSHLDTRFVGFLQSSSKFRDDS